MARGSEEKPVKKTQGELDRAREVARRKAREEAAKGQPSIIPHGPITR